MERHPHDDDVDLAIMRLAWRIDALDEWRKSVDKRLAAIETGVSQLVEADKLAEAIAANTAQATLARQQAGAFGMTRLQTWSAIAGVALTAVGLLVSALAQAGAFN